MGVFPGLLYSRMFSQSELEKQKDIYLSKVIAHIEDPGDSNQGNMATKEWLIKHGFRHFLSMIMSLNWDVLNFLKLMKKKTSLSKDLFRRVL
jgi:hypothetical protein